MLAAGPSRVSRSVELVTTALAHVSVPYTLAFAALIARTGAPVREGRRPPGFSSSGASGGESRSDAGFRRPSDAPPRLAAFRFTRQI